jgi:hypothetical protein
VDSSVSVPISIGVLQTPFRPAILAATPNEVVEFANINETINTFVEVGEAGRQKPLLNVNVTLLDIINGNNSILILSNRSSFYPIIPAGDMQGIKYQLQIPLEYGNYTGKVDITSENAGTLEMNVSVFVIKVTCYQNAECGSDSFIGVPYCFNGSVYQEYRVNICNSPGGADASCYYNDMRVLLQNCSYGCGSGQCVTPLETDYVAVYHFDEGSGNITYDNSGHGYNGTLTNCRWNNQSDSRNGTSSISFLAPGDKIELPLGLLNNTSSGAVDVWIYPVARGNYSYIISEENPRMWNYFGLYLDEQGRIIYRMYNGADLYSNKTVPLNNWTHVTVTWNGTVRKIYINENLDGMFYDNGIIPPLTSVVKIYLGTQVTTLTNRFVGRIDDLRIINSSFVFQSLAGDVNGDCIVNVLDLAMVGRCFGRQPTNSCMIADLNKDSKINILDLATVGRNFGKTC